MKLTRKVIVKNSLGIHTRPATTIVKLLQNCRCDISFTHRRETVNAKSILSILMLAAKKNSHITITCTPREGHLDDAVETMEKLLAAFESKFGE